LVESVSVSKAEVALEGRVHPREMYAGAEVTPTRGSPEAIVKVVATASAPTAAKDEPGEPTLVTVITAEEPEAMLIVADGKGLEANEVETVESFKHDST